jgi:hypothetical protein
MSAVYRSGGNASAFVLTALITVGPVYEECPATIALHGVGTAVAAHVEPYVKCLQANSGTPDHIRLICSEVRSTAADPRGRALNKEKLRRAMEWLDAMVEKGAGCETRIYVGA